MGIKTLTSVGAWAPHGTGGGHSPAEGPSKPFQGDIDPRAAYDILAREAASALVDVRTMAEWSFVGTPDLGKLGKKPLFIEWQSFPSMGINGRFLEELRREVASCGLDETASLIFICRSGGRSRAAALAAGSGGFARCFNLAGGFEGDLGPDRHRGRHNGWKALGLPWLQT